MAFDKDCKLFRSELQVYVCNRAPLSADNQKLRLAIVLPGKVLAGHHMHKDVQHRLSASAGMDRASFAVKEWFQAERPTNGHGERLVYAERTLCRERC